MSKITQMMSPEVVSVLSRSIAEAAQRKHGQTTPLHVAATLFAAPSGFIQSSCLRPDKCRALEVCFSFALDRLPSDGGQTSAHSPLSNSLDAVLERVQASQRRGCPGHPQQLAAPLLPVMVEIEHLVVWTLDDPLVSRVMLEAGFSSAAVHQLFSSSSSNTSTFPPVPVLTMPPSPVFPVPSFPAANLSANPRLLDGSGAAGAGDGEQQQTEEVKRVMSTLSRSKKRNPMIGTQQELPEILPSSTSTGMATDHLLSKETQLKKWLEVCHSFSNAPSPPWLLRSRNSLAASLPETSVIVDFLNQLKTGFADVVDDETVKNLYEGLLEKVSWQPEAASATATTLLRPEPSKRRGHTWLLYLGPDKIGKRKMATALSELVFKTPPVVVKFSGTDCEEEGEHTVRLRGWTSKDRLAEAIRRNPSSLVLIEEFDRADDILVRRSIKSAIEQGRMADSYAREVSLGIVIFVLTSNWLPEDLKRSHELSIQYEKKVLRAAARRRQLLLQLQIELATEKTPSKRGVDWQGDGDPPAKLPRPLPLSLSLELSLASRCHATVGRDVSKEPLAVGADEDSTLSVAAELEQLVDAAVVFKPVDFAPMRQRATEAISKSFAAAVEEKSAEWPIKIDEEAMDMVVGVLWIAGGEFEGWCEKALTPLCKELMKDSLIAADSGAFVRLSVLEDSGATAVGDGADRV